VCCFFFPKRGKAGLKCEAIGDGQPCRSSLPAATNKTILLLPPRMWPIFASSSANVVVVVVVLLYFLHAAHLADALLPLHHHHHHGCHPRNVLVRSSIPRRSLLGSGTTTTMLDTTNHRQRPHLNIIIPAYNEESRISATLQSCTRYLESSSDWSTSYTILVVDDGSSDDTANVVRRFATTNMMSSSCPGNIQCISLARNCGKGAALAEGIARVSALRIATSTSSSTPRRRQQHLILTADADGSADLACVDDLFRELERSLATTMAQQQPSNDWDDDDDVPVLVCGYRTYQDDDNNRRAMGRLIFSWGFRTVVRLVCGDPQCRDTQCGFKLMTVAAAINLYHGLHLARWSHDVEVLLRARRLHIPVTEAPVRWVDQVQGSKLVQEGIVKVAAQMFFDVIRCRVAYGLGIWTVVTAATAAAPPKLPVDRGGQ
jgi:dolichyl-phosphate beta-glucosyltransferase